MAVEKLEETDLDDRHAEQHDGMRAGAQNNRILHGGGIGSSS